MSTAQNKAKIERLFTEAMNGKNLSVVNDVIGDNFVNHSMQMPMPGPEGFKMIMDGFHSAFPDFHIRLDHVLADGDLVASHGVWTGTNEGSFMGMPPTGKKVSLPFMDIWKFDGDKATDNWVSMDNAALMQQLGAMPQPA